MAKLNGDPVALRHQAALAADVASAVDHARSSMTHQARVTRWQGRQHERMLAEVAGIDAELRESVDRLLDARNRLNNHANWVAEQQQALLQLERRVRDWVARHPPGSGAATGAPDASILGPGLPSRLSLRWRDCATLLRRHGASF